MCKPIFVIGKSNIEGDTTQLDNELRPLISRNADESEFDALSIKYNLSRDMINRRSIEIGLILMKEEQDEQTVNHNQDSILNCEEQVTWLRNTWKNPEGKGFQKASAKQRTPKGIPSYNNTDHERVESALKFVNPVDRDDWIALLMALKHGDIPFEIADEWSATKPGYRGTESARDRWDTCHPRGDITLASIFYRAKESGWTDPIKKKQKPKQSKPEQQTMNGERGNHYNQEKEISTDNSQLGVARATIESYGDSAPGSIPADPFEQTDRGWYHKLLKNGQWETTWLSSPFDVLADTFHKGSDNGDDNYGRLLQIKNLRGKTKEILVKRELFSGSGEEVRRILLRNGMKIVADKRGRDLLSVLLQTVQPPEPKFIYCVDKSGWTTDGAFVLPDGTVIGDSDQEIRLDSNSSVNHGVAQRGSLLDWQTNLSKLCTGNSRLIFALSFALAPPLLRVLGIKGTGCNLHGPSSIGKTITLLIMATVWGLSDFMKSMRASANGLEGAGVTHNDLPLLLDEINQSKGKEAGEIAYMLANGDGKMRANQTGGARSIAKFELMFFITGEKTLEQHIAASGIDVLPGQLTRCLELSADTGRFGVFENLHGFPNGREFSDALKQATQKNYGLAGPEFIKQIILNRQSLIEDFPSFAQDFLKEYTQPDASGQVLRAAEKFALIAFTGEAATRLGITGWEQGEALQAAATMLKAWLDGRGSQGNMEKTLLLAQVKLFFEMHGISRFEHSRGDSRTINNRAGYFDFAAKEFWVLPETFKKELVRGYSVQTAVKILSEHGWLIPYKKTPIDRGEPTWVVKPFSDVAPKRVYKFKDVLAED